jgi:creatinine amidohydrolase
VTIHYELAAMTSPEFRRALETIEIALIPVGATEQHGPNLALATDHVVAHRLAQRLAQRVHPRAVVVPPNPFGFSHHHTGFAGTITLSPETFTAMCMDTARSLKHNGIGHLLFVNGHMGNTALLNVITNKIFYELGVPSATCFYFAQAADKLKAHGKTARYGHGCEIETSVLLYLAPEYVRRDALEPGKVLETGLKYAVSNQPFALQMPLPFHRQTANGVFGDARLANEEIGRDIVETTLDRTVEFIDGFVKTKADDIPLPPL